MYWRLVAFPAKTETKEVPNVLKGLKGIMTSTVSQM
jgi:hypothetical protein